MTMNQILANIMVEHPCQDATAKPTAPKLRHVTPLDRAEEENRRGNFNLEEGYMSVLPSYAGSKFSLDALASMNSQLESILSDNNVKRNSNNIRENQSGTSQS